MHGWCVDGVYSDGIHLTVAASWGQPGARNRQATPLHPNPIILLPPLLRHPTPLMFRNQHLRNNGPHLQGPSLGHAAIFLRDHLLPHVRAGVLVQLFFRAEHVERAPGAGGLVHPPAFVLHRVHVEEAVIAGGELLPQGLGGLQGRGLESDEEGSLFLGHGVSLRGG